MTDVKLSTLSYLPPVFYEHEERHSHVAFWEVYDQVRSNLIEMQYFKVCAIYRRIGLLLRV